MWYLNAERESIQVAAREFAERAIRPLLKDMVLKGRYLDDLIKHMGKLGFIGLPYPEEVGGAGSDWTSFGIAMEEISKVSTTVGLIALLNTVITGMPISVMGSERQKEKFLKPCLKGEMNLAIAIMEPAEVYNLPAYTTRAVKEGNEWVINGQKIFTSGGGRVDYYVLLAETSDIDGSCDGLTYFIVPSESAGINVGPSEYMLEWRGSSSSQIFCSNVRISDDHRLGNIGEGLIQNTLEWTALECLGFGPMCLGSAQATYQNALDYVHNRLCSGSSEFDYHAARKELAQMYLDIETLRGMTYMVLTKVDAGEGCVRDMLGLKIKGAEIQERVTSKAVSIMDGTNFVLENDVERHFRDARVNAVGGVSVTKLTDLVGDML